MNIYLLIENGESFCIRANSMDEAVQVCKKSYLEDRKEERGRNMITEEIFYNEQILQSCSLVGQLKK